MTSHVETVAGASDTPDREITFIGIVNAVLRQRRIIARSVVAFAIAGLVLAVLPGPTYTSRASFVLQGRQRSTAQGLAAQFGVVLPSAGADPTQSPEFYSDLVRTRSVLAPIAQATYNRGSSEHETPVNLPDIWHITAATPAERLEKTINVLRAKIHVSTELRTGLIDVWTTTDSPTLSYQIVSQVLAQLNRFNLETRQSQATAERRFADERLAAAREQLQIAADSLLEDELHNRNIGNAPELASRRERLMNAVAFRRQLYVTLAQADEQAKIDEVRDTPVISVVDAPIVPVWRDGRGTIQHTLFGGLLGFVLGLVLAFMRDQSNQAAGEEELEFAKLRHETLLDFIRPWRLFAFNRS